MANTHWCVKTLGHFLKENATEIAANMTKLEWCHEQGEGLIDKYRKPAFWFFTFGIGAGVAVFKQRRYLLNLVLRCKRKDGRRLYEVDPDQRHLNAAEDDLKHLLEFANSLLMRRDKDRTADVCRPIYNTLSLCTTICLQALTDCKKDLEELIEYRDHEYKPAKMSSPGRFFYNVKQLLTSSPVGCRKRCTRWKLPYLKLPARLTCRRRLPSPAEAEGQLDYMRRKQDAEPYIPASIRNALVQHMMQSCGYSRRSLQRRNQRNELDADGTVVRMQNDDEADQRGRLTEDEVNQEIDAILASLDEDGRWARRKVENGMTAVRQYVGRPRSATRGSDDEDQLRERSLQSEGRGDTPPMNTMPARLSGGVGMAAAES